MGLGAGLYPQRFRIIILFNTALGMDVGHRGTQAGNEIVDRITPFTW